MGSLKAELQIGAVTPVYLVSLAGLMGILLACPILHLRWLRSTALPYLSPMAACIAWSPIYLCPDTAGCIVPGGERLRPGGQGDGEAGSWKVRRKEEEGK